MKKQTFRYQSLSKVKHILLPPELNILRSIPALLGSIKFPEKAEDFDWTELLQNGKEARDYQVECLITALQQDAVAVLPTGAGKTLIASMLFKRMKELNPDKLGLLIVDKIPLVYQQTKVSLLCCPLITFTFL